MAKTKKVNNLKNAYVVIDDSGNVIDNAQDYGYTTAKKAMAAYYYKCNKTTIDAKREQIKQWCKQNKKVANCYNDCILDDYMHDPDFAGTTKHKKEVFLVVLTNYNVNITSLPFTIDEFVKLYK